MTASVADIIRVMEEIAPMRLAETWDNPGLQVGNPGWPVKKIMISLDPTPLVIAHAAEASVDMLITHHPLLFRPIRTVDLATPVGEVIGTAIRNSIALYAAHTNYDSAPDGLNDMLAESLGLKNVTVLAPQGDASALGTGQSGGDGLGRIGDLPEPADMMSLCRMLKGVLGLDTVRLAGNAKRGVSRVAICTGSGGSLLERFFSSGADVFITGDVKYHEARDAEDRQVALIDIGHFGSEHIMVAQLGERLAGMLEKRHPDVIVVTCGVEKDPFIVV